MESVKAIRHRDYLAHHEERLAKSREYRRLNRGAILARRRNRTPDEKTAFSVSVMASQRRHPEAMRARRRKYGAAHREEIRFATALWRRANPEKRAAQKRRRLHLARGAAFEEVTSREIYERDKGRCGICGRPVVFDEMTLDHIVPVSAGGGFTRMNLRLAHRRCNSIRGNRLPAQTKML